MKNDKFKNKTTKASVEAYLSGVIQRVDAEQAAAGSHEAWLEERGWQNATKQDTYVPLTAISEERAIAEALKLATAVKEDVYVIPFTVGEFTRFRIALAAEVGEDGPKMIGFAEPPYQGMFDGLSYPAKFTTIAEFQADITNRISGRALFIAA